MKTTPLHAKHLELKAKMAEFAGYDMPIQYETGVLAEHNWTREKCGLFDVSHMGQIMIEGPEQAIADFWEKLTPSAISKLPHGVAKYTVMTNAEGGIIDDLIITHMDETRFFAVLNAGCKEKDIAWIRSNLPPGLDFMEWTDFGLLALQGPRAEAVLKDVLGKAIPFDFSDLGYMRCLPFGPFIISRLGYTGEDGFEISLNPDAAIQMWDRFLEHPDVKPIGLAARDSLRLEMGYPLYGHDITADTTPLEADLGWIMGKDRSGYIGHDKIGTPKRRRLGIKLTGKGIAREGAEIFTKSGQKLGEITSGGFSPTLNEAIGQGYVDTSLGKIGDEVLVRVRGRDIEAVIAPLPFVQPKTKRASK